MKNLSVVLNSVVLVAVVVLFVLHFKGEGEQALSNEGVAQTETGFPLAFINTDSLLLKYEYAKVLNEKILSKEEASRADFNEKAVVFQQDMVEFQRKLQNNGFLSLDRAKKEEQRLAKAEQDLQQLNNRLSTELMAEQEKINKELRDSLVNYLKEYNKSKAYQVILSNTLGDNVLYNENGVDITDEIVEALNAQYQASLK
jgi:outer membrane protein